MLTHVKIIFKKTKYSRIFMKIGIITHYLHFGYGGVMQNFALQMVLKQMGHTPVTLRVGIEKDKSFMKRCRNFIVRQLHALRNIDSGITEEQDYFVSKEVELFISKYINCTSQNRTNDEFRISAQQEKCEAIIVGSDQIWRTNFDYVDNCFLDFATDLKVLKIAYAASFGVENWNFSPKETEKYRRLAQQFDAISVREDSGISLCHRYLDRDDAKLVLDPTLLLDKDNYIKLAEEANEEPSQGNLFTYVLDKTEEKERIINQFSEKYSLKRFECMPKYATTFENVKKHPNDCVYPPITKWLRSFMDAEWVITDSFHGTVFSIIFNKPFYVLLNKERGTARFMSLLKMFRLEDRIIQNSDIDLRNIDWDYVNNRRAELIKKSMTILSGALLKNI